MTVVQRAPLRELTADAYLLTRVRSAQLRGRAARPGRQRLAIRGRDDEYIAAEGQYRIEELDELLIQHPAEVPYLE